jgi:TIR domain
VDTVLPPEQPPYLVILETSIGAGRIQGRVEYVKPSQDRLRVRWGVGLLPEGYQKEGGGVVFVADQSKPIPPDENPPIRLDNGYYVYPEGLGGADWLMLVMILPIGYILSDSIPPPDGSHLFEDRLAVYWRLSKSPGLPEYVEVKWRLREGDVRDALRDIQPTAPFPFDGGEPPAFAVFLCYRTDDSWAVGRISDRLIPCFGPHSVFRDKYSIQPGADFRREIDNAVGKCKVMLAVIGAAWLDPPKPRGERRIDFKDDWLRIEIESALQRHRWIIPILLDGVRMPDTDGLPDSVRELAYRQACTLRESTFDTDVGRLVETLQEYFGRTENKGTRG